MLQELLDLVANSGSMAPGELAQRKEDLKRKQKRKLVDFDTLTKQVLKQNQRNLLSLIASPKLHTPNQM